ncbi:MAG TPA: DUF1801 domain-containing protein [Candidatus Limnocylindrales bacterium]|nr:DUF1801 domain-containing protein [Candidatus Limnocylindrales bacterium]
MPDPETIDEYLATLPDDRREAMKQIREAIRTAAPDATEVITYKMPGFKTHGRFLVSFDAYKRHYSLFPASDPVVRELGDRIEPYLAGQGTIRFPADQPIPTDLITEVVRIRVVENDEAAAR